MTFCENPLSRSRLGIKRTWAVALQMSAFDPKRDMNNERRSEEFEEQSAGSAIVRVFNKGEILMNQPHKQAVPILGFWGVRYQVEDVDRSINFYTQHLGFKLDHKHPPAFAQVSTGNLKLILSGPGASGSRAMPDGSPQKPGGWNRVILQVSDLPAQIRTLEKAGFHFRNQMESGPGGKQIQLADPDGNPIELFEPAG